MRKTLIYTILSLVPFLCYGQTELNGVLQEIETNNTTLAALRKQVETEKIGHRTGIYLANPEIEFNYLWGNPKLIGKRTDLALSQSFDFPTAYGYRRKIADLKDVNADLVYKSERINLLLSAKQVYTELVYYNALIREFRIRLQNAERIAETYRIQLDRGDVNIFEHNKAQLNLTSIRAELAKLEAERVSYLIELQRMNGGSEITVSQDAFNIYPLPPDFDTWYAGMEEKNPLLLYVRGEIEIGKENVKLSRALALPKFSTGYMSEKVVGEHFQGVSAGVSIPLWENKNQQKYAQAQVLTSEMMLHDRKVQFYNHLQGLYRKAAVLQQNAQDFRQTIATNRNEVLLNKALESGEISLLEYLVEIGYYYEAFEKVLEAERDYEIALAELSAVEL